MGVHEERREEKRLDKIREKGGGERKLWDDRKRKTGEERKAEKMKHK